jgi:glycosyltransferase involved in cell wall biosynthesis
VEYVFISQRQRELETAVGRAAVIHHGVNVDAYSPSLHDDGYVLHLGRFAPEKGTHLAIDAAGMARVPIVIAGRTHEKDDDRRYFSRQLAARLERPYVTAVGEADHARKVALLRGARALLCPVQWEEPFGLIAIEAMISGTPVIAFGRGSFPEIIDDEVTGAIVADVGEMVRAIERARRWDRRACMTRARERFSCQRMASDYEHLFESRLRQSGRITVQKSTPVSRLTG